MLTNGNDDSPGLNIVASGYDIQCGCGDDFNEVHIQLDDLETEHGCYVYECPECHYRHVFDGGDISHAF